MEKNLFDRINHIVSIVVLAFASTVYLATIEPTTSFWDCGEFIASSYKLEVGHAPGNPAFNLFARLFTMFTDKEHAAMAVNSLSALCSGLTIFFLYLSIVHFGRRIMQIRKKEMTKGNAIALFGAGVVGALAYCFSDTFWFSAVEGEVYAMSSLFTAVVFWAILKWEEQSDRQYANRWLVLICFLMGISIGVHLLNLLTVPAIVFIYYYKKHPENISVKKSFGILCVSGVILAVILFGIIPYLPHLAAFFDRIFVNGFGAKFNVGATVFMVLFLALCFLGLKICRRKDKAALHTILLCFTSIVIGYSLFAISMIRSCAGTPTNEYQPDNPYTLIRYLGREQYGSSPLLYGQSFLSPYEIKEKDYYTPLDGKYFKASNVDATYPSSVKMLFPRMWNGNDQRYINFYKSYCDSYKTKRAVLYGQPQNIQMPAFKDNLKFFFDYQVNYMYVRYFMWNFVGRQNDFHGQVPGDLISGNWESGITFLDKLRLGDQSEGPDIFVNNKGKNHYFFLPFILGLIGLFFQIKHDSRNSWVTGLLFLLTGLAIVVYLNQTPYQVRERDYAYAGSFYVFALWIGLGVLALQDWFENLLKKENSIGVASAATALGLVIPVIMGCENWDDHDRSGRYTARDLAYNYLTSVDKNGILVTHGDNDTFPLWYAQEVEEIRTDIRIVNSSLLGTDWYIDQMQQKFYDSDPLVLSIPRRQYLYGTNDFVPVVDAVDYPILASDAINVFKNPKYVTTKGSDYIPSHTLIVPVNKENVIRNGIVPEKYQDRILDSIVINIKEDHLSKFDLIMLDFLANYDWSKPLYFVSRGETKLGLDNYLLSEGFSYKLIPVEKMEDEDILIDEDEMYDRLMNVYRFDSLKDTTIYVDYQNIYTFCAVSPIRDIFAETANALIDNGKKDKAIQLLDKCMEVLPQKNFPYNLASLRSMNEWALLSIFESYLILGEKEKAADLAEKFADECIDAMLFFSTSVGPGENDVLSAKYSETTVQLYFYMVRICENRGEKELADRLQAKIDNL
ncbi:MAG: DUF2723 domain-containing protein [Bacteroidales bacterium]|nr:DUF2723 domain-containing protein [Candidatus Cacconaster merdequi]